MKVDVNILNQLAPRFGVRPYSSKYKDATLSRTSEVPPSQTIYTLKHYGFVWDNSIKAYKKGDQVVYALANFSVWVWNDLLFRTVDGYKLIKWIGGNTEYPNGKANAFMDKYNELLGNSDKVSGPIPDRSSVGNAKPNDRVESIIKNAIKKAGPKKQLSSDEILDIYNISKELQSTDPTGSKKLLDFIKTLSVLNENIKKTTLENLIRKIVSKTISEVSLIKKKKLEEDGAAPSGPIGNTTAAMDVTRTPLAFKKEPTIDEQNTTNSGTPGYNIPGAFSKKGGSEAGLAGSRALGYELTPIGQKEMTRSADKLLEHNPKKI